MKRIIYIFAFILSTIFSSNASAFFWNKSMISTIKNSPCIYDNSTTYDKILSTYSPCTNGEWTDFENNRGQNFVLWKCDYGKDSMLESGLIYYAYIDRTSDENINRLKSYIEKASELNLVVLFKLSHDKKDFEYVGLGYEYEGQLHDPIFLGRNISEELWKCIFNNRYLPYLSFSDFIVK